MFIIYLMCVTTWHSKYASSLTKTKFRGRNTVVLACSWTLYVHFWDNNKRSLSQHPIKVFWIKLLISHHHIGNAQTIKSQWSFAVLADSPSFLQEDCPEGRTTPLKRQTSVLKPSESFIRSSSKKIQSTCQEDLTLPESNIQMALRDRQQSVQMAEVDSDSDSLGELSVVHTGLSGWGQSVG